MTVNEKLNILLKKQYIEAIDDPMLRRFWFSYQNQYYVINKTIENIIKISFEYNLRRSVCNSIKGLQKTIASKSKISPVGKEYQKELLDRLIQKEKIEMQDHIGEIEVYNTPEHWLSQWPALLLGNEIEYNGIVRNNGLDLIYDVFEIANQDIDGFLIVLKNLKPDYKPGYVPFNYKIREFDWICNFFNHDIEIIFTAISCDEKIKYLKNEIDELENSKPTITQKTEKIIPDFDSMLSEIKNSENKFWKGMDMENVIEHFKVLTERKGRNGNTFLSIEQFISFLKKGFLNDKDQPKQKINYSPGEKGLVILLFYNFYQNAVRLGYPSKKNKFIKLFTDCFDNWDPHTIPSFFKGGKTIEKW